MHIGDEALRAAQSKREERLQCIGGISRILWLWYNWRRCLSRPCRHSRHTRALVCERVEWLSETEKQKTESLSPKIATTSNSKNSGQLPCCCPSQFLQPFLIQKKLERLVYQYWKTFVFFVCSLLQRIPHFNCLVDTRRLVAFVIIITYSKLGQPIFLATLNTFHSCVRSTHNQQHRRTDIRFLLE